MSVPDDKQVMSVGGNRLEFPARIDKTLEIAGYTAVLLLNREPGGALNMAKQIPDNVCCVGPDGRIAWYIGEIVPGPFVYTHIHSADGKTLSVFSYYGVRWDIDVAARQVLGKQNAR